MDACMRRQGGSRARWGAPEPCKPRIGSDQLAPLTFHCPWGGSKCHPERVASGSRWGEGLAGHAETRRGNAMEASPPSQSANPGPAGEGADQVTGSALEPPLPLLRPF